MCFATLLPQVASLHDAVPVLHQQEEARQGITCLGRLPCSPFAHIPKRIRTNHDDSEPSINSSADNDDITNDHNFACLEQYDHIHDATQHDKHVQYSRDDHCVAVLRG